VNQLDIFADAPFWRAEAPRARKRDPETSKAAAASATRLAADHHALILDALARGPAGKDRLAVITRLTGVQCCRRLCELERAGLIRPTGKTVTSTAGRQEREWCRA
jgi:predicted Rossmann fold nucleotide-binding protein DprA/Smf involved in DNA uptake